MTVLGEPTVSVPRPAELRDPETGRLLKRLGMERLPLVIVRLAEPVVTASVRVPPTLHPSKPKGAPPLTVRDMEPVAPPVDSVRGVGVVTVRVWPRKASVALAEKVVALAERITENAPLVRVNPKMVTWVAERVRVPEVSEARS